jgi:hypothetical protein
VRRETNYAWRSALCGHLQMRSELHAVMSYDRAVKMSTVTTHEVLDHDVRLIVHLRMSFYAKAMQHCASDSVAVSRRTFVPPHWYSLLATELNNRGETCGVHGAKAWLKRNTRLHSPVEVSSSSGKRSRSRFESVVQRRLAWRKFKSG